MATITKEQLNIILKNAPTGVDKVKLVEDLVIENGYEIEGLNSNIIKQNAKGVVKKEPTAIERVKSSIEEKGENVQEAISGTGEYAGKSALERGVGATAEAFSALSSTLYNILPEKARQTLDVAAGGIGKGMNFLADKIGSNPKLQEAVTSGNTTELESALQIASDLGLISGEIAGAKAGADIAQYPVTIAKKQITKMATQPEALSNLADLTGTTLDKVSEILPKSPEIMNRVARLTPKQAQEFKRLSGKTHGEYLTETGNFGSPDKIIQKEAQKFTQSLTSVDDELAKLPGTYKDGSISDALDGLTERAKATSGTNVESPFLKQVNEWKTKLANEGLTMEEINQLKRLYEREVKLGYNKLTDSNKVAQATNIDNALRKWQVNQAEKLGFENISELNKQTQLSKFIINNLGDQVVGKTGLNNIGLTDWIILAGGDPTAVATFLTKRFFSSKSVQAKIAEMLNKAEVKSIITPKTKITPENIERQVSPQGFKQLPEGTSKTQEIRVPIQLRGKFEMEKGVPKTSKPTTQSKSKTKLKKA